MKEQSLLWNNTVHEGISSTSISLRLLGVGWWVERDDRGEGNRIQS